jgi:hypothetical protein
MYLSSRVIQTIILQSERHVLSSKGSYRRDLEAVKKTYLLTVKSVILVCHVVLFVMTSFVKLNLQFEHVSLVPTELSGIYPLPSYAVLSKKNY